MTFRYLFTRCAWLMVLLLGLAHSAFAQLTLDAFSPADGATGVATTPTVEFTFSAALDTTASFDEDDDPTFDDFFLNLTMFPNPGDPLDVRVSGDGRTVALDLRLEDDTQYQLILEGAFSTTGAALDLPHEFTFTTGDVLPRGSITGKITYDGNVPKGTVVAVFLALAGEPAFEDDAVAAAVVPDSTGDYTADFVPAGDYVVAAFLDQNGDGVADDPYEDALRGYDGDGDTLFDVLTVGEGVTVNDIDFAIEIPVRNTARGPFPFAQLLSRLFAADARLGFTFSEVTPEGTSPTWGYAFYSPAGTDTLGILAVGDQFAAGPGFLDDGDDAAGDTTDSDPFPFDILMPLPEDWVDSSVALDSAEARGGAEFRALNPDAQITMFLGNIPEELCALISKNDRVGALLPQERSPQALAGTIAQLAGKTAAPADAIAYWLVFYFPEKNAENPFAVCVDAQTGEAPPPREMTTARPNLDAADEAARTWAADAQLVSVSTTNEGIDSTGLALNWIYAYYSPALDQAQIFFLSDTLFLAQEDVDTNEVRSLDPLPENWIDSDVAASEADANSFGFRDDHPDAVVFGTLSRGQLGRDSGRAVWQFLYVSQQDNALQVVNVDGETGIVVKVEEEPGVPSAFVLEQNYPNPFNPETRVPFGLVRAGHVTLTIYNVLGQRVATLVDQFLPAGSYSFAWQPNALPSGLYLYQLKTNDGVLHRTMTLLR